MHATAHRWRSEHNLQALFLASDHVVSRDLTQDGHSAFTIELSLTQSVFFSSTEVIFPLLGCGTRTGTKIVCSRHIFPFQIPVSVGKVVCEQKHLLQMAICGSDNRVRRNDALAARPGVAWPSPCPLGIGLSQPVTTSFFAGRICVQP